jgi:isopenicillin-N N-acyltransferase-like protein
MLRELRLRQVGTPAARGRSFVALKSCRALPLLAACVFAAACAPARPAAAPSLRASRIPSAEPELADGVAFVGDSWVRRVGPGAGVLVGRFEGRPYELGLAYGRLNRARIAFQEGRLEGIFRTVLPSPLLRFGIRQLSAFRIRRLDRAIPSDLLLTIAGLADGYEPETPRGRWPAYRRMLDLHALHEVSQRFIDAPGTRFACTGFLAAGKAAGGRTLLARNFDFEGGAVFDQEKLVSVVAAEGKVPYLSVAFGGLVGVVTGFNRAGIAVAVQSLAGGETARSGEPITIVLADVLANETTLDGAIERVRRARVFVSDIVLLADGASGRLAVVEKTPHAFSVRRGGPDGWLAAANAAESPDVARWVRTPAGSTSLAREARLVQILSTRTGPLDVPAAVAILRDTRSASGVALGPGNRNAIDAHIAAHSVVFDLGALRAWVAAAPHTQGAYVPVDLLAVLAARRGADLSTGVPIPADPFLTSGGYDRYLEARSAIARARSLSRHRDGTWKNEARLLLEDAHRLAPDFAAGTALLAERLAHDGDRARARALAEEALAHQPGPDPFSTALSRLREALASGRPLPAERLPYILEPDELVASSPSADLPLAR